MKTYVNSDQHDDIMSREHFNAKEVALFKHLNKEKTNLATEKDVLQYIHKILFIFNIPENRTALYYHLWVTNYQETADYGSITINREGLESTPKDDIVVFSYYTKPNYCDCIKNKIPFDFYGYEGGWMSDEFGSKYYRVHRTFWTCLYLFKGDRWYVVNDTKGLKCTLADFTKVNFFEIKNLMDGNETWEDVVSKRIDSIIEHSGGFLGKRIQSRIRGVKTVYKMVSAVRDGNLINFTVELLPSSDYPTDSEDLFKKILTKLYLSIKLDLTDLIGKINVKQSSTED
jgi:hypothetical protein